MPSFRPLRGTAAKDFDKATRVHYFRHNIGDYRRDTAHLTLLEHGCYRQLLDTYYLHEQAIPLDIDSVCRRLLARSDDERKAVEAILAEFFTRTDEGWIHGRCDAEIAEYHSRADKARENGKQGGRPKRTQPVIPGNPDLTDEKANQKPITKKPTTKEEVVGFDEFWSAYPRKVAKADAAKAWEKVSPDQGTLKSILAGLEAAKSSRDWMKDSGQFIPHAATWINGRRWEDDASAQGAAAPADAFEGLI